jgi:tRNA/rRNA methyltransferase
MNSFVYRNGCVLLIALHSYCACRALITPVSTKSLITQRVRRSYCSMRTFVSDKKTGADSVWQLAKRNQVKMPVIILVQPYLDQNVGSVSRCMLNWGLSELRIIDPQCDIYSDQARALAVGSVELLQNAKIYQTLDECVKDLHKVIATTARRRDMNQLVHTPETAAVDAINSANINTNSDSDSDSDTMSDSCAGVGIVFGRERGGLTNAEMALADCTVHIPAFEHYEVLNLAQAVNIIGYELWKYQLTVRNELNKTAVLKSRTVDRPANREELDSFLVRLEESLHERRYRSISKNNNKGGGGDEVVATAAGADIHSAAATATDEKAERMLQFRNLGAIFRRVGLTRAEVSLLHGMLTSLLRLKYKDGKYEAESDVDITEP